MSKRPRRNHGPASKVNDVVKDAAMAAGVMMYPRGGTIDGRQGDHVIIAPPYTARPEDIDRIVDLLGQAIEGVLGYASLPTISINPTSAWTGFSTLSLQAWPVRSLPGHPGILFREEARPLRR
ncbi:MAG: aspartate aminotransferase family protein [Roseomonas sp.]|nr:aspartate aminotransferase family protein [Roseomonas sp.]